MADVRNLYRISLALPLVLPAIAGFVLWLVPSSSPPGVQMLLIFVAASALIGGVPYILLALIFLLWARNKDETAMRRALWLSPVILIGAMLAIGMEYLAGTVLVGVEIKPSDLDGDMVLGILQIAAYCLGFGYGYVLLVFGLVAILRRVLPGSPNS